MATYRQIALKKKRVHKKRKQKKIALNNCPQKKGTCTKVYTITPKKPCSARRAVCRVKLSNKKLVFCHIPGIGHNLKKFSVVLVRGGRPNDLPAVKYKTIRHAFDLLDVYKRRSSRSKYGVRNTTRALRTRRALNLKNKENQKFNKI